MWVVKHGAPDFYILDVFCPTFITELLIFTGI